MPKTVASLGGKKFERISRTKTNKILSNIPNDLVRSKLKKEIRYYKFGAGGSSSIKDIAKNIGEVHGSLAVDKFIRAIIKNSQNNLPDEKKKEKNINYSKQQRINEAAAEVGDSVIAGRAISTGTTYINKNSSGEKVESNRVRGSMESNKVKEVSIVDKKVNRGFASQYKDNKLPDSSVSGASLEESRPIGF